MTTPPSARTRGAEVPLVESPGTRTVAAQQPLNPEPPAYEEEKFEPEHTAHSAGEDDYDEDKFEPEHTAHSAAAHDAQGEVASAEPPAPPVISVDARITAALSYLAVAVSAIQPSPVWHSGAPLGEGSSATRSFVTEQLAEGFDGVEGCVCSMGRATTMLLSGKGELFSIKAKPDDGVEECAVQWNAGGRLVRYEAVHNEVYRTVDGVRDPAKPLSFLNLSDALPDPPHDNTVLRILHQISGVAGVPNDLSPVQVAKESGIISEVCADEMAAAVDEKATEKKAPPSWVKEAVDEKATEKKAPPSWVKEAVDEKAT
eukprot:Hpha_TRINITY_DN9591_c0_g1::TRINITY_DN9591_c0_g1_i1::g.115047::m.115047